MSDAYAEVAADDGRWRRSPRPHWASAFALGALWLTDPDQAAQVADRLGPTAPERVDGFTAFVDWFTLGTGGAALREPAIISARALAARCQAQTGLLAVEEATPAAWLGADRSSKVAFVDPLGPVVSLLCTGAELTGEIALAELAAAQVRTMLGALRREDGSFAQVVAFEPATGTPSQAWTGEQGYGPTSTWSRGAAWALLGAATAAARLPDEGTRAAAEHGATWWTTRAEELGSWVPPWDFDAPGAEEPVDTSAAAIAAAALARIPGRVDAARAALAELAEWVTEDGRLLGGCYHLPDQLAVADELVWGSYYLVEATAILSGRRDPATL